MEALQPQVIPLQVNQVIIMLVEVQFIVIIRAIIIVVMKVCL